MFWFRFQYCADTAAARSFSVVLLRLTKFDTDCN